MYFSFFTQITVILKVRNSMKHDQCQGCSDLQTKSVEYSSEKKQFISLLVALNATQYKSICPSHFLKFKELYVLYVLATEKFGPESCLCGLKLPFFILVNTSGGLVEIKAKAVCIYSCLFLFGWLSGSGCFRIVFQNYLSVHPNEIRREQTPSHAGNLWKSNRVKNLKLFSVEHVFSKCVNIGYV